MTPDYYALLEVPPAADEDTLKKVLAQQAIQWSKRVPMASSMEKRHEAESMVKLLGEARKVLLDPELRDAYDRALRATLPVEIEPSVEPSAAPARGVADGSTAPAPGQAAGSRAAISFKFKQGEAFTLGALIQLCDAHPDEAIDYFERGYLEQWFANGLGEAAFATECRHLRENHAEHANQGLELCLRAAARKIGLLGVPRPVAVPDHIDLGPLPHGARASALIRIENAGRGTLWGKASLETPQAGLDVTPNFNIDEPTIGVALQTHGMKLGEHTQHVEVQVEGAPSTLVVPIRWTVEQVKYRLETAQVELLDLPPNQDIEHFFAIERDGGYGDLAGTASLIPPILGVVLSCDLTSATPGFRLKFNTAALEAGNLYQGYVLLELNGQQHRVPLALSIPNNLRWPFGLALLAGGLGGGLFYLAAGLFIHHGYALWVVAALALAAGIYGSTRGRGFLASQLRGGVIALFVVAAILLGADLAARPLLAFGLERPLRWALLGAGVGAFAGFGVGLRRAGLKRKAKICWIALALLLGGLLLGGYLIAPSALEADIQVF